MAILWPVQRWVEYPDFNGLGLPDGGGCYAVYADGELVYIGQSSRLRHRLADHKIRFSYGSDIITPWGYFASVRIKVKMPKRFGEWAMTELRLIRRLKPKFNQTGKKERRAIQCIA
jgi:hypothetical protein